MPQDGAPSSIDVLAAQVREPIRRYLRLAGDVNPRRVQSWIDALAALDALVARVTEAERGRKAAEEWARVMEHERDYEQEVVSRDLSERLADARNALERIEAMPYGSAAQELAREVLARLDGNQP